MYCFRCFDFLDRQAMTKCDKCTMYFCEECYLEHATDPFEYLCKPRHEPKPRKVSRVKRKLKQNKKMTVDLCDLCHQEFLECDLIKGQEPFATEIYGSGEYCKLCRTCHEESLADI